MDKDTSQPRVSNNFTTAAALSHEHGLFPTGIISQDLNRNLINVSWDDYEYFEASYKHSPADGLAKIIVRFGGVHGKTHALARALIDSGATISLVSSQLVEQLGLPTQPCVKKLFVADGASFSAAQKVTTGLRICGTVFHREIITLRLVSRAGTWSHKS